MAKKEKDALKLLQSGAARQLLTIQELDLMVLRGHALLESVLYMVLGGRLGVDEADLPDLNFDRLARLALAGSEYVPQRELVLLLNRLRNTVAHDFDPGDIRTSASQLAEQAMALEARATPRPSLPPSQAFGRAILMLIASISATFAEVPLRAIRDQVLDSGA